MFRPSEDVHGREGVDSVGVDRNVVIVSAFCNLGAAERDVVFLQVEDQIKAC